METVSPLLLLQKALRRVPFAPLDVNCLHCLEYFAERCGTDNPANQGQRIVIRAGTPSDIQRISECGNFPDRLPERFRAQEHCVVATIGEQVIGYQWFCDKPSRTEERYGYKVEISPDSIYGYDAFVLPHYRRAKVWTRFHALYLNDLLARLRRRRVIVMVDHGNGISMSAHLRVGYRLYRKVYVAKLLRKSIWISKSVRDSDVEFRSVASVDATRADQMSGAPS